MQAWLQVHLRPRHPAPILQLQARTLQALSSTGLRCLKAMRKSVYASGVCASSFWIEAVLQMQQQVLGSTGLQCLQAMPEGLVRMCCFHESVLHTSGAPTAAVAWVGAGCCD
jgi:hypothetical protein